MCPNRHIQKCRNDAMCHIVTAIIRVDPRADASICVHMANSTRSNGNSQKLAGGGYFCYWHYRTVVQTPSMEQPTALFLHGSQCSFEARLLLGLTELAID